MAEYLERLVRRLNPPSTGVPPQSAHITPSVRVAAADVEPEDSFEEIDHLTFAETASFKPAPVEGGIDPPPPLAAGPTPFDSVSQPAGTLRATPPPATRNTAAFIPNATPAVPDGSSTRVSEKRFQEFPPFESTRLKETHRLTQTIPIEKEAPRAAMLAFRKPISHMSANSQPGLSNQDEIEPHQRKKPPALETMEEPIAPVSSNPQTEPVAAIRNQPPPDHTTQAHQLTGQSEEPPPPRYAEPKEMPTLYPSPTPSPLRAPQQERPRLVIGHLHVEVAPPPKASPPASSTAKPVRRTPSRVPSHRPAPSKLRFGLGQL